MSKLSLKDMRKERGLTMQEFAELLNVTRQQVHNWERKINKPQSTKKIRLISQVLNRPMEDVLNYFFMEGK